MIWKQSNREGKISDILEKEKIYQILDHVDM